MKATYKSCKYVSKARIKQDSQVPLPQSRGNMHYMEKKGLLNLFSQENKIAHSDFEKC